MEYNEDEVIEPIDFSTIRFRTEFLDRGSYVALTVYSSDLNDPCGSYTFTKSDPNYRAKIDAIKSTIGWLNESISKKQ